MITTITIAQALIRFGLANDESHAALMIKDGKVMIISRLVDSHLDTMADIDDLTFWIDDDPHEETIHLGYRMPKFRPDILQLTGIKYFD